MDQAWIQQASTWAQQERTASFLCDKAVTDYITSNYANDEKASGHYIGFVYLSVGCVEAEVIKTSRYMLFIPNYDPGTHGYIFKIAKPFVYASGFKGVLSTKFYSFMKSKWDELMRIIKEEDGGETDFSRLNDCSPVVVASLASDAVGDNKVQFIKWGSSARESKDTWSIQLGEFECWIHGAQQIATKVIKDTKNDEERVNAFRNCLKAGDLTKMEELMKKLMSSSNSFSYPTIQIQLRSLVPGGPLRVVVGGEIREADAHDNAAHIPVALAGIEAKQLPFQNLWDGLFAKLDLQTRKSLNETYRRMGRELRALLS